MFCKAKLVSRRIIYENPKKRIKLFLKSGVLSLLFILSLAVRLGAQETAQAPSENKTAQADEKRKKKFRNLKKKEIRFFTA